MKCYSSVDEISSIQYKILFYLNIIIFWLYIYIYIHTVSIKKYAALTHTRSLLSVILQLLFSSLHSLTHQNSWKPLFVCYWIFTFNNTVARAIRFQYSRVCFYMYLKCYGPVVYTNMLCLIYIWYMLSVIFGFLCQKMNFEH